MINTITLSTEMEKLYLIDNGRAIEFPLDNKVGVLIGTLKGQITVVSAIESPVLSGDLAQPVKPELLVKMASRLPVNRKLVLQVPRNQWTVFYNKDFRALAVIGATDVDFGIAAPEAPDASPPDIKTQLFVFNIARNVVHLRRVDNQLEFTLLEKD